MSSLTSDLAGRLAASEGEPDARLTAMRHGPRRGSANYVRALSARIVMYVVLAIMLIIVFIPFIWMLSSSLKLNNQVLTVPVEWWPRKFVWSNYADIWTKIPLLTYLRNSGFLAIVITFLQVLTGSFAAYGFSKIRFPGRDVLFFSYIATIAIPWQAYMIPQYIMMQHAHLTNTFWSLILLQAFGAFGVFLMRQFYMTIPDDLSEAARIDGLSDYGIWARIILPLSKPALASLALLTFVTTWNDYMGPFIYLSSNNLWTVQIGLRAFIGLYSADYALIMAGSVISILPILVIFLFGQKYFIKGIATSGMKG